MSNSIYVPMEEGRIAQFEIPCDAGKVSDGYHTFDELYDHRCVLFMAFIEAVRDTRLCWKSRKHSDGEEWPGWFIAGTTLNGKSITYHLPEKYWDICGAQEQETAPEWDGHTSADVLARLLAWIK
jgi:hypothetical protein